MLKVSTIIIKRIRRYRRSPTVNLAGGRIIRRACLLLVRKLYRLTLSITDLVLSVLKILRRDLSELASSIELVEL